MDKRPGDLGKKYLEIMTQPLVLTPEDEAKLLAVLKKKDEMNPAYPNGQCPACGQGLDNEKRCQDQDCNNYDPSHFINNNENEYFFNVKVIASSLEEAEQVMIERINYEEDYGFDYTIEWIV